MICRCEEVYLSDILDAIKCGAITSKDVKLRTRAAMGICQSKTCRPLLEQVISFYTNSELPEKTHLTHNIPIRPLTIAELAKNY
ncbi:(2Fe-2S)-binding protein [Sporosarcina siberiensis]|uniref:(2Fe-2S)-binding protein n=1 Tax=Sporosarcina siberiensis TaxID=1365606 RepID=A0ABW4SF69_9BACL